MSTATVTVTGRTRVYALPPTCTFGRVTHDPWTIGPPWLDSIDALPSQWIELRWFPDATSWGFRVLAASAQTSCQGSKHGLPAGWQRTGPNAPILGPGGIVVELAKTAPRPLLYDWANATFYNDGNVARCVEATEGGFVTVGDPAGQPVPTGVPFASPLGIVSFWPTESVTATRAEGAYSLSSNAVHLGVRWVAGHPEAVVRVGGRDRTVIGMTEASALMGYLAPRLAGVLHPLEHDEAWQYWHDALTSRNLPLPKGYSEGRFREFRSRIRGELAAHPTLVNVYEVFWVGKGPRAKAMLDIPPERCFVEG